MITVRFPSGFSVQYNDAHYVVWANAGAPHRIYTRKDGDLVASAPQGCVIEFMRPCRTYQAITSREAIEALLREIDSDRKSISAYDLAALKGRLRDFDALRKRWKP